ncbi:MAG: hypothetical protein ACYDIA_15715 [Candidatus Humimicrobiaceae bacterium]
MKRCPKCERFSVEYDPYIEAERCIWYDCLWINKENIDLDKQKVNYNFKAFKETLKTKKVIGI